MALTNRDKRALMILGAAVVVAGAYLFWPTSVSAPTAATADTVATAEFNLNRLRNIAASAPAKQDVLKKVSSELASREAGLIRAESAQQAQAQTITILRELLDEESVAITSTELGALQALGTEYGLAPVSVQLECHVDQLLNALAALSAREELLAVRDVQIAAADLQRKTVRVRLTVASVIPKSLLPAKDRKGGTTF